MASSETLDGSSMSVPWKQENRTSGLTSKRIINVQVTGQSGGQKVTLRSQILDKTYICMVALLRQLILTEDSMIQFKMNLFGQVLPLPET